jgi:hypothetical protein
MNLNDFIPGENEVEDLYKVQLSYGCLCKYFPELDEMSKSQHSDEVAASTGIYKEECPL